MEKRWARVAQQAPCKYTCPHTLYSYGYLRAEKLSTTYVEHIPRKRDKQQRSRCGAKKKGKNRLNPNPKRQTTPNTQTSTHGCKHTEILANTSATREKTTPSAEDMQKRTVYGDFQNKHALQYRWGVRKRPRFVEDSCTVQVSFFLQCSPQLDKQHVHPPVFLRNPIHTQRPTQPTSRIIKVLDPKSYKPYWKAALLSPWCQKYLAS